MKAVVKKFLGKRFSFTSLYPTVMALMMLLLAPKNFAQLPAIPEPGLLMYGAISNSSSGSLLTAASVSWTITGNNSTSSIPCTIVAVNNQFFYLTKVPFETRHLGSVNFTATTNVIAFNPAPINYTRSVLVNGASAVIAASSRGHLGTFPFGASDRGSVERVDLTVSLATESFAQWSLRFFGTNNVNPNADSDGDGVSNYLEYLGGTDPTDRHSLLTMTNIQPDPQAGIVISWQSAPSKTYSILRSSSLAQGFIPLQTHIPATAPLNSFRDPTATGIGPYFYRVQLETN